MERTDLFKALDKFTERLTSQTYLDTYREQGRSSLLKDGLGTRANSIWKMAEYVVLYIDDKNDTPIDNYLKGWAELCKNYKNQFLIIEVKDGEWEMYDSNGNFLGDNGFIIQHLNDLAEQKQIIDNDSEPTKESSISLPNCEVIHKNGMFYFKFRFPYEKKDFMDETFLTEDETDEIVTILKRNKNIILQGAPGVGKTWTAKRIAYLMMGGVDEDRIQTVQFHQTYSYDSFIEGYRPDEGSFHLEPGVFRAFCKKAAEDEYKRDYFFIIDEINRGNISKIMGEVLSLIEVGYRGKEHSMKLSYNSEFYVPENLYIIGMMNTADRSLSIIDYALRRRFAFISMTPKFESEGFKSFNSAIHNPKYKKVIDAVIDLNKEISDDPALGKGFEIGHSYFCLKNEVKDAELLTILKYQIIPMIREYWFDNPSKAEEEAKKLLESVK